MKNPKACIYFQLLLFMIPLLQDVVQATSTLPIVEESPAKAQSFSISQWVPMPLRTPEQKAAGLPGGEGMQQMCDLAYSPSDPNIVYLGVDTSQVWKSTDGGRNWVWSGWGFNAHGARSIVVDPDNPNLVWAAGFHGGSDKRSVRGVFFTGNGGKSWEFQHEFGFFIGQSRGKMLALVLDNGNKKLYASPQDGGLQFSVDKGKTWSKMAFDYSKIHDIEPDPCRSGHLYIACNNGLYVLEPGKSRPTKIGNKLPSYPISVSASAKPEGIVYVALGHNGIYKSDDYGEIFSKASPETSQNESFNEVRTSPVYGNIAYTMPHRSSAYQGLFVTKNGGVHWTMVGSKDTNVNFGLFPQYKLGQWIHSPIAPHPKHAAFALIGVNGDDIIVKTEDAGTTWQYSNNGYRGGRMRDISFFSPDGFTIALTDFGLWHTDNNGQSFVQFETGRMFGSMSSYSVATATVKIDNKEYRKVLATLGTWSKKGIILSIDGGKKWKKFEERKGPLNFVAIHNQDPKILYAGSFRSFDGGNTWMSIPYEIQAVFPKNNDILYAFQNSIDGFECLRSKDRGSTWEAIGKPLKHISVSDIAVHPTKSDLLWLASDAGVILFDGEKWNLRNDSHGLERDSHGLQNVQCIAVDPNEPNILYAGRRGWANGPSNGVFRSTDGGMNWEKFSANLPEPLDVWSINISPFKDGSVYIGTSLGTYRMP